MQNQEQYQKEESQDKFNPSLMFIFIYNSAEFDQSELIDNIPLNLA